MKDDKLEIYVRENRDQFDQIESPDFDAIWKGIPEDKPTKNSNLGMYDLLGIILTLVVILIGSWIFLTRPAENSIHHFAMNSPEHKDHQAELLQFVNEREKLVASESIDRSEFEDIFNELNELELMQENLELDFQKYGDKEELMRTLFKYYERKARILEILLFEIDKKKNYENINHHKTI